MQIPWEAIVALAIYIISSTIGFIVWLCRIAVTLEFMSKTVDIMAKQMVQQEAIYAKKEDVAKDLHYQEKRIDAIGLKLDALKG